MIRGVKINSRGITYSSFGLSVLLQFADLIQIERYTEKTYNVANLAHQLYFQIQFISVDVHDSGLSVIRPCQVDLLRSIKVACRVQIGKKAFCQNSNKFCYSFIKNVIMFMYLLYIYKKAIILSLFKIDTLNFTMYILANLTCPLKTCDRLHNLISMTIFFTIKDHSFSL